MSGSSNLQGDESILFTDNASFDGTERGGKMTTDGQLFIGHTASTRPNNGGHVVVGQITSPGGTISVGFSDPNITLDVAGGAMAVDSFALQGGTTPVVPDGTGLVTFSGQSVGSGTIPVRTFGTGANEMTLQVQRSQAIAGTNASNVGLSAFDSSDFTVDVNGFVQLSGTGAGQTITGDSGGALSPTAGNWNILGGPGVTTTGSGSTLTINSVEYTDHAAGTTVAADSGSMSTAAITLTLPAAPANGTRCEFVASTADQLVIDAPGTALIHLGTAVTSAGGTATSSGQGDSMSLIYQSSTDDWFAISSIGVWVLA